MGRNGKSQAGAQRAPGTREGTREGLFGTISGRKRFHLPPGMNVVSPRWDVHGDFGHRGRLRRGNQPY